MGAGVTGQAAPTEIYRHFLVIDARPNRPSYRLGMDEPH